MKKNVRYSSIDNIEDVVKEFSSKSSYGNVSLAAFYKISMAWNTIVGITLAKICQPTYYDSRRILTIVVADSTWANEIMFSKSAVIKKIDDTLNIKVQNITTRIGDIKKALDITDKEKSNVINDKLLEQKTITEQEQGWIDDIVGNIENKELREKLSSTLSVYVKTGGDTTE